MKIHIALLGKEVLPVYYPIKQYKPDVVYIIGTEENSKLADRLVTLLTQPQGDDLKENMPQVNTMRFIKTEAYNFIATFNICHQIHNSHNSVPPENITYNLTGGTKIMALAAFAVAQTNKAKVIYTEATNVKTIFSDHVDDTPLNCNLTLYEIIALQGQKILEADRYDPQKDSLEIEAAKKSRDFICRYRDLYEEIRKCIGRNRYNDTASIPNDISFSFRYTNYRLKCGKRSKSGIRKLTIENEDNKILLSITCKNPKDMLLKGVWWEMLVATTIHMLYPDYEVWRNVKFKQVNDANGNAVKNEIDVLLNIGNRFLFVECKSGKFESGNLHKLNTVKNTYGGGKSKAVLVMASPLDGNDKKSLLHENAEDNDIRIISPSLKQPYASDAFLCQTLPCAIKDIIAKLSL